MYSGGGGDARKENSPAQTPKDREHYEGLDLYRRESGASQRAQRSENSPSMAMVSRASRDRLTARLTQLTAE